MAARVPGASSGFGPAPLGATSPVTTVPLRCHSCGAAYARATGQEVLTCEFCGTSQRVVDARQFLDFFTSQVTAFVRLAVPAGLDASASGSVDVVARLSAFNASVRPRLTTELEQYRFALFDLLANPVMLLPFRGGVPRPPTASPAGVSVFVAKVQSVAGLATDDASRELLTQAGAVASAYRSLLVATDLLAGTKPERYHLAQQCLTTASASIAGTARWAPVATRLAALAKLAAAADSVLAGMNGEETRSTLAEAGKGLVEASGGLTAMPELAYMVPPVDSELASVRTVGSMAAIVQGSPTVSPPPLEYLRRLSGLLERLSHQTPPDWSSAFGSARLWEEVFARAAELRAAQAGQGAVRVLPVGSGPLAPFWVVELPYTFETGVLWAKRGKEVPEQLLVSATFPTDPAVLERTGAARALTDVFRAATGGRPSGQFYDRLAGKEQAISRGGGLAAALQGVSYLDLGGRPASPPTTTAPEALKLVRLYLEGVRLTNAKAAAQLQSSSPRILDLVYIPCSVPGPIPIPWLGDLSPMSLGDPQALLSLAS
jgi:hypothetical protein